MALLLATITVCSNSYAAEPLNYDIPLKPQEASKLERHLEKPLAGNFRISKVDLNDDGLYEYVVQNTSCTAQKFCTFDILSDTKDNFFKLGRIKAKSMALSNIYTSGVRNLLVYNNNKNDYDYSVFVWDAPQSLYIFKEAGS